MGARGPQGKPTELKVLEGNRGHRPLDLSSIYRPEVGLPTMPKYLSREAQKAWKQLTPELMKYNLISLGDGSALEVLVRTIGRLAVIERSLMRKADELRKAGKDESDALFDATPNGMKIQSAIYQALCREQEKLHKWLGSFGLRPDARADVTRAVQAQLQLFEGGAQAAPEQAAAGFAGFK